MIAEAKASIVSRDIVYICWFYFRGFGYNPLDLLLVWPIGTSTMASADIVAYLVLRFRWVMADGEELQATSYIHIGATRSVFMLFVHLVFSWLISVLGWHVDDIFYFHDGWLFYFLCWIMLCGLVFNKALCFRYVSCWLFISINLWFSGFCVLCHGHNPPIAKCHNVFQQVRFHLVTRVELNRVEN